MHAKIYSNDFNRMISAVKAFVGSRGAHEFIRLEFNADDSCVTAVSCNGYCLATEHAVCECDENAVVYVKPNMKLPRDVYIVVEKIGKDVTFRCKDFTFGYEQPLGDFIDYEKAVPKESTFRIGFNGNYLLSALQAAKVSAGGTYNNPIILEFNGPTSPCVIRTNTSDVKMVLPLRIKDE